MHHNGIEGQLENIASPSISPPNPELGEELWGRRAQRAYTLPVPWPPASLYLLLLLLCNHVCVVVHSLFRLTLIHAVLLIKALGLGEPTNRAGAC